MLEKKFNDGWKYWIDKNAFALVWNIPENAKDITLPHDAMLEKDAYAKSFNKGNTGYRDGDIYNYVKLFYAEEEYKNKAVILKFEGIYMNAMVYVNGQLVAKNPYGYTTFYTRLNDYLKYGKENEIRVIVRNGAMTNSRWYSGGGIYRDVYLLVSDLTYITPDGAQIATESIDNSYGVINVSTEIKNEYYGFRELEVEITIKDKNENVVTVDKIPVTLFKEDERKILQRVLIENPNLWNEENPYLYTCVTRIYENNKVIDESISKFGIRTLKVDAKRGLRVNNKTVKLRGACVHHDSGLLGAATYDDAKYRQIKILKEAGFNAIRMSHQPISQSMLRACDELGMYVMDELCDMWNRCKSDYDYGLNFQEWWEKDVTAMVRKDFNHPSVILYSIGNEIPEIATNQGTKISHDICKKIKELDNTRYTLASINGVFASGDSIGKITKDVVTEISKDGAIDGNVNDFMSIMDKHMDKIVIHPIITKNLEKACAYTDIAGYNYMAARYENDGRDYPNRVIVGSETYPPEISRNWSLVEKCDHVIGDFTWTGWDYIGEAGVGIPAYKWGEGGFGATYPCQLAYCGDIDITGFRRPASYYREIVFGMRKNPYITVQNPYRYGENLIKTPWVISDNISSWTFNKEYEGKPVILEIYSPGDEVEVICNGKSLGKKVTGKEVDFITYFDAIYEPGKLTAVSYENSIEVGRMDLETVDNNHEIVMKVEDTKGKELIYIPIEIQDSKGNLATEDIVILEVAVEGGADVIGFGSGNPKTLYNYNGTKTEIFQGRALLILKKNNKENKIRIKLTSDNDMSKEMNILV